MRPGNELMKAAPTLLVFCAAGLLAFGMVALYSASMAQVGTNCLMQQLVWCALGLGVALVAATVDYRRWQKFAWVFLGIAVLLLVLVLTNGTVHKGARRWIEGHGLRLQPSEFAKLAIIVFLAHYGSRFQRKMPSFLGGVIIPCVLIGVALGLIFVEPDRGTTVFIAVVSAIMLFLAGVRWLHVLLPVALSATALAFSLVHDPMRWTRIMSYLDVEATKEGVGMQAWHAKLAFGAGGWTGLGLGNGRQKLGFIPEQHTDFILPVIGEELGLVASLLVVLAYVTIVISGFSIAGRARNTFGFLLASGLTIMIGLQAAINIGVVTGVLPNKGLPLPLISYGGSNLLVMLTAIGLLLSVAIHSSTVNEAQPAYSATTEVDSPELA
jgi:cell division protein FtsW